MREVLLAGVFAAATTVAILAVPATAFAADTSEQLLLCAAAAEAEGAAPASEYRAKFLKTKGGAVKTVTIKLVPNAGDADAVVAQCKIKGGEVTEFKLKA